MSATPNLAEVPPHVPPELVFDFDPIADQLLQRDPHRSATELHRRAPRLFYTRHNCGHWVVTRAADALELLRQPERFSSDPKNNWFNAQRRPRTVPNHFDPPEHTDYRKILNPVFSPGAMQRLSGQIRATAIKFIEQVRPRGGCEFIAEIGQRFPVEIFLTMAGSPLEDAPKLLAMVDKFVRGPNATVKHEGTAELADYLVGEFDRRRAHPTGDLLSNLLTARFRDRLLNQDELLGAGVLLFLGGLDTVTSTLSFIMNYLAQNPDKYAELVATRADMGSAVEELLRVHGGAYFERAAVHDDEFHGVTIARGDRFLFMSQLYGVDDELLADPFAIDLTREIAPHLIFGAGPHRCLGSHLARVEIRVFLEEWTARIPHFHRIGDVPTRGGTVWLPSHLYLGWD